MPSTKTPRVGKPGPISYNPIFPGGRNQDRPDNQRARVAVGDAEVNATVNRDVEEYRKLHEKTWNAEAKKYGWGG